MGKGTDKLYITHSEWASEDAYSASAGSGVRPKGSTSSFKRLPFNFCAVSLQPFANPVCTVNGTIFDTENIVTWLKKHNANPIDGKPLKLNELIKLNFAKNDEGEYVDPVTFKVFTDNTHIVALRSTGNVFAYDTIERLNIKAKMWRDLVSDEEFNRKDIITLQDPQNVESRDLSSFKYLRDGTSTLTEEQERERNDPSRNVNKDALGNASRILKAKEAVALARSKRDSSKPNQNPAHSGTKHSSSVVSMANAPVSKSISDASKPALPFNAAQHTTGKAAASLTSTGLTPHTASDRALLSHEDYLLRPRRVKKTGFVRLRTNHGPLDLELRPEHAPKAVWNFIKLVDKGYYDGVIFHRSIRSFMIQGGDPTGTGKGGASVWGKNFVDEFGGPGVHDRRGVLSMANKGKDTNGSQFFILYRQARHLDRKHTVFGQVVGDEALRTLDRLETLEVSDKDKRPLEDVVIEGATVLVDPFEEWEKERNEREAGERERDEIARQGGAEDERVTWTGKRVRGMGGVVDGRDEGVGKYLKVAEADTNGGSDGYAGEEILEEWEVEEEPLKKKSKGVGGFGNFDSW